MSFLGLVCTDSEEGKSERVGANGRSCLRDVHGSFSELQGGSPNLVSPNLAPGCVAFGVVVSTSEPEVNLKVNLKVNRAISLDRA